MPAINKHYNSLGPFISYKEKKMSPTEDLNFFITLHPQPCLGGLGVYLH